MKKLCLLFLLTCSFIFALSGYSYAAGTCTVTTDSDMGVAQVKWSWTCTSGGAVSGEGAIRVSGVVLGVRFVPGSGVTNLYDVYIKDSNDVDILGARGVDLSSTASTSTNYRTPLTGTDSHKIVLMEQTLTPTVAAAGDAKSGTIYLYLSRP